LRAATFKKDNKLIIVVAVWDFGKRRTAAAFPK
jgi:hypothetical protein